MQNSMETNSRNQNPKNLEDLIFHEVLPRIPSKSLLRFKTVARHWNAFITSVEFVKTHVRHLPSLNSRSVLTIDRDHSFQFVDYGEGMKKIAETQSGFFDWLLSSFKALLAFLLSPFVKSDDKNLEVDDCLYYGKGIAMKSFGEIQIDAYELLSSCNGIAFLVSLSVDDLHCRFGFNYVLYNPVLGPDHFVKIPHPDKYRLGGEVPSPTYGFGFAYVSSTEDYYIVAIDLPRGLEVVVNLYSVRSKEWKCCVVTLMLEETTLPVQFEKYWYRNTATVIKETLHWCISQGDRPKFIFAYDLATLSNWLLPYITKFGDSAEGDVTDLGLCCLDDCLCAWAKDGRNVVEMWMLKPHQEGISWTKLFRIQTNFPAPNFFGFNKTRQFLVFGGNYKLYLSDLNCNTPAVCVLENIWNVVNYVPSLESVLAITNSEPNED